MHPDHKTIVAVVCGGSSAEAGISQISGRGVADALKVTYPKTITFNLDASVAEALSHHEVNVVFPVLHGPPGEDGTFQGLLEILGIPYVGSGVRASACAMDKILAKHLFRQAGLRVARDIIVNKADEIHMSVKRVMETLGPHVVVKPSGQGSALGVSFPESVPALEKSLKTAFMLDECLLVEERIIGREITAALIERPELYALPVVEVRTPAGSWYDFKHRYTVGFSQHIVPAPLPDWQYRAVQEYAKKAHAALGCRDLSRVDFVVPEKGEPVILEVNTLPGMTPTSLYPDAARAAGISFQNLVAELVLRALTRNR